MKVKHSNQIAIVDLAETATGDGLYADSLEDFFPDLEASDAIIIKKVVYNQDKTSGGINLTA